MAEPPKYLQNAINYVGWRLSTGSAISDAQEGLARRYPRLTLEETSLALEQGQFLTDLVSWANVAPEMATLRQTAREGTQFPEEIQVTVREVIIDEHGNKRYHSEKVIVSPDDTIQDIANAAAAARSKAGDVYDEFDDADYVIDHIDFYPNPE